LPVTDLVHVDFNLSNVLIDTDGLLAGVLDTEVLGAGSRTIDYALL